MGLLFVGRANFWRCVQGAAPVHLNTPPRLGADASSFTIRIASCPYLQWGSHPTQFYASGDELRDVLVPYFQAGLENNESCLWVTGSAFNAEEARSASRAVFPDLDQREVNRQIELPMRRSGIQRARSSSLTTLSPVSSSAKWTRSKRATWDCGPMAIVRGSRTISGKTSRNMKRLVHNFVRGRRPIMLCHKDCRLRPL